MIARAMGLEGRTCIVTGGSRGLGKNTALGLARLGAEVVLVSRDEERGNAARDEVARTSGNDRVAWCFADLSSQASVRALAAELVLRPGSLAVLVNNAAFANPERHVTADGLERQFAVNHLAPFLLANLLRERLVADAPARVVNVSSLAHQRATLDFDDLQGERDYSGPRAYDRSKLANVLFTYELARRLRGTGVTANCLHPGTARTALNNYLRGPAGDPALRRFARRLRQGASALLGRSKIGSVEEASRTSIHLASSPDVEGVTSRYFVDCREAPSAPATHDEELAARLWEVSARLTGLSDGPRAARAAGSGGTPTRGRRR